MKLLATASLLYGTYAFLRSAMVPDPVGVAFGMIMITVGAWMFWTD